MDDPRWLRLITIGLVLAAVAVGYFLLSGTLSTRTAETDSQINQESPLPIVSASPAVLGQNNRIQTGADGTSRRPVVSPAPSSAFEIISDRTKGGVQTAQTTQALPRTGFPIGLTVVLAVSAAIAGWGLRRFPD